MLDARLLTAAELLGECERFIDVGANHGFLGAYMLRQGLCREALITDISAKALERAQRTLEEEGIRESASLLVTDGVQGIQLREADGVAVCGMGCRTILHILGDGFPCKAVLQPNVELPLLRQSLGEKSMRITMERIAKSAGRFYVLVLAEPGKEEPYTPKEAILGRYIRKDPLFKEYLTWRRGVAQSALKGALSGSDQDKLIKAKTEMEALEEAL